MQISLALTPHQKKFHFLDKSQYRKPQPTKRQNCGTSAIKILVARFTSEPMKGTKVTGCPEKSLLHTAPWAFGFICGSFSSVRPHTDMVSIAIKEQHLSFHVCEYQK